MKHIFVILKRSLPVILVRASYFSTNRQCGKPRTLEPPWKICFFGNDNFALETLKRLNAKLNTGTLISSLSVITNEKTPIRTFSEAEKLPVLDWPIDAEAAKATFDIGIVVSFGYLIPKKLIEAFPLGCINVHSSILPKYRGPAPIIHALINGELETGVTVMKIQPHRFDEGEIVRQYRIPIYSNEYLPELEHRLAMHGAELLMECVRDFPQCLNKAIPQPSEGSSHAPKVTPGMANINWKNMTSHQLFNLHRAIGHIYPLCTTWHGVPIKMNEVNTDKSNFLPRNGKEEKNEILLRKNALSFLNDNKIIADDTMSKQAGKIEFSRKDKLVKVTCKDGSLLRIDTLTINGKRISAFDFFNGYLTKRPKEEWTFGI